MIVDPLKIPSTHDTLPMPASNPVRLPVSPHTADRDRLRDTLHGLLAGVAGTWALDRVDWFFYDREPEWSRRRTWQVRPGNEDPAHALATRLERLAGVRPSPRSHEGAGLSIHYLAGTLPAGLYGALRPRARSAVAQGLAYGLVAFLGDLFGSPASGLAAPARAYPMRVHARSLAAHLAYGLVTEAAIRVLERRSAAAPNR